MAKRRMRVAYAWLDQNAKFLMPLGFNDCIAEAKERLSQRGQK
jgi:hypothetical protein